MTEREVIKSPITGDSFIRVKHSSGLVIYICEMPGFSSVDAMFCTKYGSVNTVFRQKGDTEYTTVPEGIAHFLEHKLFENEDSKVFELYARTGASGNAYTSFEKTCYYFSCTKNYQESLRILLNFVQKPYFTKENVDKEMGIIGQEIRMTNESPDWRIYFNMARCMFHNHPVKNDIAGTAGSIAEINAELLYKCYNAFYNLNNMVLSVAGNVSAEEVLAVCDECLVPSEDNGLETVMPDEPAEIVCPEIREKLRVGSDIFNIGYKCSPCSGRERLRRTLTASIASSMLSDPSTDMYRRLLSEGMINSTFGAEVFNGDGFFTVIFSGESSKPELIRDSLTAEIERIRIEGIDEKDFQRTKKSTYGILIRELNNVDSVASLMLNSHIDGVSPYDSMELLAGLKSSDVYDFICSELHSSRRVLSIIERLV